MLCHLFKRRSWYILNLGVAEASGNFPIITSANPDLLSSNQLSLNVVGQVIKHVYLNSR